MNNKEKIENIVSEYFKVDVDELYSTHRQDYPYNGARRILMYLLYANGMKSYVIAEFFNLTSRRVYIMLGEVQVAIKSDSKVKDDVKQIEEMLNKKVK